jgi:hypothetical protein
MVTPAELPAPARYQATITTAAVAGVTVAYVTAALHVPPSSWSTVWPRARAQPSRPCAGLSLPGLSSPFRPRRSRPAGNLRPCCPAGSSLRPTFGLVDPRAVPAFRTGWDAGSDGSAELSHDH